jgi:hypothetical protein
LSCHKSIPALVFHATIAWEVCKVEGENSLDFSNSLAVRIEY